MKLNIQWKKVLYGIALIVISIILAALHLLWLEKVSDILLLALLQLYRYLLGIQA